MQQLVLFTSGYPYGSDETFLETEILYLSSVFEQVTIVATSEKQAPQRTVPDNCKVINLPLDYSKKTQIKSIRNIVNPIVVKELSVVKQIYKQKISRRILKTLLVSFERSKKITDFILSDYSEGLENILFYSYWCDDTALGIALAHHKNKRVKGISRMHRWDIYFEESQVNYLPFRHFISQHLKKIISISQDGIDYAIQNWKVKPETFVLSRLGIKNPTGQLIPNNAVLRIISCSNVIKVKRVHLIAETLQKISNLNVEWTHFGDGLLINNLKEQVRQLPSNIKVNLPGRIPNKQIFTAYQDIKPHLFINVSSSEGIPVSIMEAMSFGVPCIAFHAGGNAEIVNNENGALLAQTSGISEIKSAIFEVYKNYQQKSKSAYKTWGEDYDAEKNYPRFCELLKHILSS